MGRGGSEKRAGPFGFAQGKQARPYGEQRRDGTGLKARHYIPEVAVSRAWKTE